MEPEMGIVSWHQQQKPSPLTFPRPTAYDWQLKEMLLLPATMALPFSFQMPWGCLALLHLCAAL
jgi:hypothetical protein